MNHVGIFLDRDGTINEDVDFLSDADALRLIPGSAEAIRTANNANAKVVVVTNQSGIARGIMSENALHSIHQRLEALLRETGAHIDAFYYCPHHPDVGPPQYRRECDCRKPNIGMLRQAASELSIDLKRSFIIGDKLIDVQTGRNAGIMSILVMTGYGRSELALCKAQNILPDYVAENLAGAIGHVMTRLKQSEHSIS